MNPNDRLVAKGGWKRVVRWFSVGCVLLASGCFLISKRVLFVETGRPRAEAIILLGGHPEMRTFRVLELYRELAAPRVLLSGPGDGGFTEHLVSIAGIPREAVFVESCSRNTKENAEFSVQWVKQQHLKSAIVVTSWFHSRRALACFRRFGGDIEFYSCPAYHGASMRSQPRLREVYDILREYAAIGWYWMRYRISPFFD